MSIYLILYFQSNLSFNFYKVLLVKKKLNIFLLFVYINPLIHLNDDICPINILKYH